MARCRGCPIWVKGRVFLGEMLEGGNQHHVFEHIGVVARVEGVAVTEHGADGNARGPQSEMKNGPRGPSFYLLITTCN